MLSRIIDDCLSHRLADCHSDADYDAVDRISDCLDHSKHAYRDVCIDAEFGALASYSS